LSESTRVGDLSVNFDPMPVGNLRHEDVIIAGNNLGVVHVICRSDPSQYPHEHEIKVDVGGEFFPIEDFYLHIATESELLVRMVVRKEIYAVLRQVREASNLTKPSNQEKRWWRFWKRRST